MNSVKIGTYQMDTAFGLYLPEYTIPAPAPQTKFVKIIGRDGSVDLSDAIGLHYDSRSWSLDFKCFDPTVNWHTLTSSVMNAIHGKRLNFEFDDDPDYFWTGRISVSSYVSTRGTGTLKVNITSDPFKYAKLSTIVTKTASTGTEYTGSMVTFNDGLIYDLSADIEPTQDLHGYENPWPAGGGVNILPPPTSATAGISGTITNDNGFLTISTTGENVTFTIQMPEFTFAASGQKIELLNSFTNGTVYFLNGNTQVDYFSLSSVNRVVSESSMSAMKGKTINRYRITVNAQTLTNATFAMMVTDSSASALTAFSPYSNICPISGLTGLSVYVSPTQNPNDATVYNVDWSTQAGTVYGGTVDPVTGQLTVTSAKIHLSPNDFTSWYAQYKQAYTGSIIASGVAVYDANSITYACDTFKPVANAYRPNNVGNYVSLASSGQAVACSSPAESLADFKTLIPNGIDFIYELATPVTYQLTPQEIEALVGTNNVWSSSGDVSVTVVTPETVTNNGLPAIPTVTASADMVLRWGNYSASVQQGTSTIPQLVLETGDNKICIIGAGNISFEWSEASL